MKLLEVILSNNPCIKARAVMPKKELRDKNEKPFKVGRTAFIKVRVLNDRKEEEEYIITAKKGYTYDGASIPFNIGKGDMRLLIPALFHDLMCDNKGIINKERNLSSQIFKRLLIECGINKLQAQVMYLAVDNFQRFMRGWK